MRLIPGVLGNKRSHEEDSFSDMVLLEAELHQTTQWRGLAVPEVLTSGNHARVDEWRKQQSLKRTLERRPELLEKLSWIRKTRSSWRVFVMEVSTDLSVLMTEKVERRILEGMPEQRLQTVLNRRILALRSSLSRVSRIMCSSTSTWTSMAPRRLVRMSGASSSMEPQRCR